MDSTLTAEVGISAIRSPLETSQTCSGLPTLCPGEPELDPPSTNLFPSRVNTKEFTLPTFAVIVRIKVRLGTSQSSMEVSPEPKVLPLIASVFPSGEKAMVFTLGYNVGKLVRKELVDGSKSWTPFQPATANLSPFGEYAQVVA